MDTTPLIRKWLAIGIILLTIGTYLSSPRAETSKQVQTAGKGNWLYVGGSGPGNYTEIQDAINNASDDDTIFVYESSSPYFESLIINKSISLIGENKETTIIDGTGNDEIIVIRLADYVQVCGFTIRNSSRSEIDWEYLRGVGVILLAASFCNLSDLIITNTNVGIHLLNYIWNEFTYKNTLQRNIFLYNTVSIVLDWGSGYTTIVNNELKRNWIGIVVITTNFNTIIENNFCLNFRTIFLKPDVFWPDGYPLDEINHNYWSLNYWGRPRYLRVIFGRARVVYDHASWFIRYIEVDWNPARIPYDIP